MAVFFMYLFILLNVFFNLPTEVAKKAVYFARVGPNRFSINEDKNKKYFDKAHETCF